jgi:3-isopropylmalate/(R)-2-methylmalate dehydratase small subunit
MEKFTILTGVAAPLPMTNVDTDMIIPKQFLKTIHREGLGKSLFFEHRFDDAGQEKPGFVLNKPPYRQARILIARENFGCGSSREHAPWALEDFGIRCIIAPSFADIFYNNCFLNGMLPIKLPEEQVEALLAEAEGGAFTIDLPNQKIVRPNGATMGFEIDPFFKTCLIEGLDEIGLTLQKSPFIREYETRQRASQPWLWR